MSKVGSAFVKLEPANHTMVRQILADASVGDTEMLGELGLDGVAPTTAGASSQEIGDGNTQGLAGLHVIVGGQIGISQKQDAGARRSAVGGIDTKRRAGEQATKLHFEQGDAGGEAGIAVTSAESDAAAVR